MTRMTTSPKVISSAFNEHYIKKVKLWANASSNSPPTYATQKQGSGTTLTPSYPLKWKQPHIRRWAGALFRTPPFSLLFLPITPPPLLPPRRQISARARTATMGKDKTAALERAKKVTAKAKGKRTNRRAGSRATGSARQSRRTTSTTWWKGDLSPTSRLGSRETKLSRNPERVSASS